MSQSIRIELSRKLPSAQQMLNPWNHHKSITSSDKIKHKNQTEQDQNQINYHANIVLRKRKPERNIKDYKPNRTFF